MHSHAGAWEREKTAVNTSVYALASAVLALLIPPLARLQADAFVAPSPPQGGRDLFLLVPMLPRGNEKGQRNVCIPTQERGNEKGQRNVCIPTQERGNKKGQRNVCIPTQERGNEKRPL